MIGQPSEEPSFAINSDDYQPAIDESASDLQKALDERINRDM
jgi:hypothetical protein